MSQTEPQPLAGISTTSDAPEPWRRVIKVEVPRAMYDREYADRLKKAARSHQKPGFRKGRTPKALVEKELGDMLRMETIEGLVPKAWMSAVLEHKLAPITDPELADLEFPDDGPLTFTLTVEVRPEVALGDVDGMPVKKREIEVTDADVDDVLARLRESRAEFVAVDRAAADGDQILLDLVPGSGPGVFDEEKIIPDQRFVLGSPHNVDAFNDGLVGSASGQEKDLTVTYPADHPNPQLQGRQVPFRCRIREVAEKKLPELDDTFAAAVSEGKTMVELRDEIRGDLTREAENRVAREMDRQIQLELVRRHDVSLAPSMVDKYLESGLEEMRQRQARAGRPVSEDDERRYREEGRPHAESALAAMLLLEALRKRENIKVEGSEVDERISQIAAENGFAVDRYREFVDSGGEKERIAYDLLERKSYDFLLSRAEIEIVAADTDVFPEEE